MSMEDNDRDSVRTWAYGVLAGLLFIELFLFAWCRVQCIQRGYEVTAEQVRMEKILSQQEELKVKLEHLKNPDRISKIAKERFGLAHPGPEQLKRP